MSYRDLGGKIGVWWDAEYCNSDRDDLIDTADTREQAQEIAQAWAKRKAAAMCSKSSPDFEAFVRCFFSQVSYTNW